jgi:hypothetical protein
MDFKGSTARLLGATETNLAQGPTTGVIQEFYRRYSVSDSVIAGVVLLSAQRFDESELREILRFYRSPIGAKLLAESPIINSEVGFIAQRILSEHRDDLQEMIRRSLVKPIK